VYNDCGVIVTAGPSSVKDVTVLLSKLYYYFSIVIRDDLMLERQIELICASSTHKRQGPAAMPNGGSARGYQELSAPLAIPATAEQAAAGSVCLCIASAGRDRPHLAA
jgi:hypothetical protein